MAIRTDRPYIPAKAWRLAGVYWLLLLGMSARAGTPQRILNQPLATDQQLHSLSWWGWLLASAGVTLWVYGVAWPRHTLRFGRQIRPITQSAFGLCWGVPLGLWMLTLTHWASTWQSGPSGSRPIAFLISFALISIWQAFAQSYFWGVYVAPEHDTPASNRSKVWRCHIPHLLASLLFFFLQGNAVLFIILQITSLALMSVAAAMPPWWDKTPQRAATVRPGLLGMLRTHGWEG
jgi:hypothetical protein